jgi:hypothetical protein
MWELARAWYGGRLEPDWQPRTLAESQAVLRRAGLAGPFWDLETPEDRSGSGAPT